MTATLHTYRGFVFTIEPPEEGSGYSVDFPDFPEIITSGVTMAEAFSNACEALDLHLEGFELHGQPIPQPRHRLEMQPVGGGA